MQAILEKIRFIKENIKRPATVEPFWWIVTGTDKYDAVPVLFKDEYIDYEQIINEISVLLAGTTLDVSKESKVNLAASLLKLLHRQDFNQNFPPESDVKFKTMVIELEKISRVTEGQGKPTDEDIEEAYKDREDYNRGRQRTLYHILKMRICEICDINYHYEDDLSIFSIYSVLMPDDAPENENKNTLLGFIDTDNGEKGQKWLTHQQLILLLDELGVFEFEHIKNMDKGKRAILISNLLRYDPKNTQTYIFNIGKKREDVSKEKDFVSSPANIKEVKRLLKSVGLQ